MLRSNARRVVSQGEMRVESGWRRGYRMSFEVYKVTWCRDFLKIMCFLCVCVLKVSLNKQPEGPRSLCRVSCLFCFIISSNSFARNESVCLCIRTTPTYGTQLAYNASSTHTRTVRVYYSSIIIRNTNLPARASSSIRGAREFYDDDEQRPNACVYLHMPPAVSALLGAHFIDVPKRNCIYSVGWRARARLSVCGCLARCV